MMEEKIKSFQNLPENWNGYGAKPISKDAVERALNFLYALEFIHVTNFEVFPTANDTIQFEIEI